MFHRLDPVHKHRGKGKEELVANTASLAADIIIDRLTRDQCGSVAESMGSQEALRSFHMAGGFSR